MTWKQAPVNVPRALLEGLWKGSPFERNWSPAHGIRTSRTTFAPASRGSPSCVAFSGVMCELGDDAGSGPALTRLAQGLVTPGDDDVAGDPGS